MKEPKSEKLFERRKVLIPKALGIFNPSNAVKGNGAILWNADGRELIDFGTGIGVLSTGHCLPEVVEAIKNQADKVLHTCFNVSLTEQYLDLAEKLIEIYPHGDNTKVMVTNTGAESVENAIKIARMYTKRQGILCFTGAFHGRSMMSMTLTAKNKNKTNCGPFAPEVYRLEYPYFYRYGAGLKYDDYIKLCIQKLKDFFEYNLAPEHFATVILEVVQGEGGFNVMDKTYFKALQDICKQNGILIIFDEVQSGFGRTGEWAAYNHFGIIPDISVWAKAMGGGVPIGAVIGKADIMDSALPGTIGGTYLGNPLCCAASLANINYMQKVNIPLLGKKLGEKVSAKFKEFQNKYKIIGNVRGLGSMLAFELVKNGNPLEPDAEITTKLVQLCEKKGLIILSAGTFGNCIRFLAPLNISDEILNKGLNILDEALNEIN